METGALAYMFYSENGGARAAIGINDVLPVFREDRFREMHKVGKIKVLSHAGENYYRIMVVEGEIRYGDVARKDGSSCLIILHRPGAAVE
ncbi:MAG TPA: hypothetical protein VF790_03775 [Dissulfurispiraceae bacterium]